MAAPDYTLEFLKFGGTFLSVWAGATLAWKSASRGRREDLLIKERYKLFEAQVGYIYEVNFLVTNLYYALNTLLLNPTRSRSASEQRLLGDARQFSQDLRAAHDRIIRNRKVTIFNSQQSADLYAWCSARLVRLVMQAEFLLDLVEHAEGLDLESYRLKTKEKEFYELVNEIWTDQQELLTDLYEQQEFTTWIKKPAKLSGLDDVNPFSLRVSVSTH